MSKKTTIALLAFAATLLISCGTSKNTNIPLAEHPRPDFERADFINLNGYWNFTFSEELASKGVASYDQKILVPFPWGSPLSEVADSGDVAWYGRGITVPKSWEGKRVFLVVGASDWETTAAIDGKELGVHQGGYTPFEFELTDNVTFGGTNIVTLKVDDTYSPSHLYGKQGYGNARGLWQTVYLEARGEQFIKSLHFSPDIDAQKVGVRVILNGTPAEGSQVSIAFKNKEYAAVSVPATDTVAFDIEMPGQHLWDIDDPYLYEVTASIVDAEGKTIDAVDSYYGQRKVSAMRVPGQDYKYIALNNQPLYVKLCLDQSYTPDGYYTFPSDEFMKNEIQLSKDLGLNGNRVHIKVEVPRKLYWADKLGLLIMADVPNFWGEPVPEAQQDWENCMRAQVERDFNHPCIFAWVDFNETWGLFTGKDAERSYRPETQEWVRSMYHLTKSLDPTRLVEDNSPCNNDHVETDINSWHSYQAGHRWETMANYYDKNSVVGSTFNYIGGNTVQDVPLINSECGDVWGYDGNAGDSDFSWDYHEMMNAFHRHLHIGGWLYTEHHDVINEWNGYVKYDRTRKIDGLDSFVDGMGIKDLNSDYYITPDGPLCRDIPAGSTQAIRLYSSFTTAKDPGALTLETVLTGVDPYGNAEKVSESSMPVEFRPFELVALADVNLEFPAKNGVYTLAQVLKNDKGEVLSRNFTLYVVKDVTAAANEISFSPASFTASEWSIKQTNIYDSLKVNGFGAGYFEYSVMIPEGVEVDGKEAELVFEASAKTLFGKDIEGNEYQGDFMLGGGTFDHNKSLNSYKMTDDDLFTSKVQVSVNGQDLGTFDLEDDPADSRGVLSWHAQPKTRSMRESGSYGYLIKATIPAGTLKAGEAATIRLTVPEDVPAETAGGLAIYSKAFGRYLLDPTIVVK